MAIELVAIGEVTPHPSNGRKGNVKAIQDSLDRFGQMIPIVVQASTRYIVKGNHTHAAAQKLGWDAILVDFKDLDDEQALAYLIIDNRTSDKATYDKKGQLQTLRQLELPTEDDLDDIEALENELGINAGDDDTGEVVYVPVSDGPVDDAPVEKREPLRDIVMLMPQSEAQLFGANVQALQRAWGTTKVVDTVQRAVTEAVERL